MGRCDGWWIAALRGAIGLAAIGLAGVPATADVIELRGGGQVEGKVISDPKTPATVRVLLLKGKHPLTFQSKQILNVTPKASPLDEYLVRKGRLSVTAPAEYELGLWCEQHGLADLARAHYEAAVGLDAGFEPPHRKLGHVERAGQWYTPDELRQAQGLVKYKGRWVTEAARSKGEESAQATAAQATWIRRIKALRQAIGSNDEVRRREAEAELMQIREVEAIRPLMRVLGNDAAAIRSLLAHVLGAIPGKESAHALVESLLAEDEDGVRSGFLAELKPRQDPTIVPLLIKALRSSDVKVVNRAAWAIGNLGAVEAVPALVGSLLSGVDRVVWDTPAVNGSSYLGGAPVPGPILMGANNNALAFLTPPVVAPGAVAYGATTVTYLNAEQFQNGPMGPMLGNIPPSGRGPIPRIVTDVYKNSEVLGSLMKLTGEDFGYDEAAWRRWVSESFNPHPKPERRVPQP